MSEGRDLRALWFGDEFSLIGHLHTPRGAALELCAVVCPTPFGYDNVCAHRALRTLADRLVARGIATLRFDFPGVGDSDGVQGLPAWRAAVAAAVATAKRETGRTKSALIGVGLGGTIALAALDEGLDVDKVVLWGSPVRGLPWLREQRAYQRMAAMATAPKPNSNAPPPPPAPSGVEELAGFPMTTEFAAELTAFDVRTPPAGAWPTSRPKPAALIVTRTANNDESALATALNARGIAATVEARDGLNQMFDQPHLSIAPEPVLTLMGDWLAKDMAPREARPTEASGRGDATTRLGPDGQIEEIARYGQGEAGLLFSIETRPVGREVRPTWLVLLAGGSVRHIGPNRISVRIARELAKEGYASLRLDGRGVGDSDGGGNEPRPSEEDYREHIYDDIESVMQLATAQGAKQFLMTGLCSGATASYQIAWRRSDVKAIVLLNLLQLRHDPEDNERAVVQQTMKFALRKELWTNLDSYRRLWREGLNPKMRKMLFSRAVLLAPLAKISSVVKARLKRNEPNYVVEGYNGLARRSVEIDIFLSEGDRSVSFLERHFGADLAKLSPQRIRVHRVHHTDHTIRALSAQDEFVKVLRQAVARVSTS